jgi:hypothetical protein
VWPGPACLCPAGALPRFSLFLPHPAADHWACCRPTPLVSRVAPRRPRPATLPCSLAHLHRKCTLLPPTAPPRAIPTPWSALLTAAPGALYLSHFPSSTRHQVDPHFPLLFSLARPLIWRSHQCLTPLCSVSTPELEHPSFSTTYAPASPTPTTRDPSSSLVPARATPPSTIISEHDCTLALRLNGLTPHLLPPSPALQGHTVDVIHHRSNLAAVERHRTKHPPPPPCRVAVRVSSTPNHIARRAAPGSKEANATAAATPSPSARSRRPHHRAAPERLRAR